jgi:ParB family chromosome partitioning protein
MAKKVKKKELGMGIRALLANMEDADTPEQQQEVVKELSHHTAMIPIDQVEVNPYQPRVEFQQEALEELSESIKVHGLIQPITLRRLNNDQYQLISGERRLRASKLAGLTEVPAYIRLANDQEMLEMALVENIQRQDLNPIEVAITYQRLIDECALTHEDLGGRVGKKRSTVTNFLRLLQLPPSIQQALKDRHISMGHAKALRSVDDLAVQLSLYNEVVTKALSVRATEELVRGFQQPKASEPRKAPPRLADAYQNVQDSLCSFLGTKVQLKPSKNGKGQLVINFNSDDDLNRLLDLIEKD